jgi:hypothetical protein
VGQQKAGVRQTLEAIRDLADQSARSRLAVAEAEEAAHKVQQVAAALLAAA